MDEEGGPAFGGAAAEHFRSHALEGLEFVSDAAGGGLAEGEELGKAGAHFEPADGVDGRVLVLFVAWVVGGVGDLVAVGGPDVPAVEIGQGGEEIVDGAQDGQIPAVEMGGEFAHEPEPPPAGEVLEVAAAGEFRAGGDAVGLEEVAAGFGGVEDAQDAEGGEGQVIEGFTLAGDAGGFHDVADGCEERVIEEQVGGLGRGDAGGEVRGGLRDGCGAVGHARMVDVRHWNVNML
jgi:hypothetical protein